MATTETLDIFDDQPYYFCFGTQFSMITENTSWFQTKGYFLIPSTQFLCVIDSKIQFRSPVMVER